MISLHSLFEALTARFPRRTKDDKNAPLGSAFDRASKTLIEFEEFKKRLNGIGVIRHLADVACAKANRDTTPGELSYFLEPLVSAVAKDGNGPYTLQLRTMPLPSYPPDRALFLAWKRSRLLIEVGSVGHDGDGEPCFRLSHEAIIRDWPSAWEWFTLAAPYLAERWNFQQKADQWDQEGRPAIGLSSQHDINTAA